MSSSHSCNLGVGCEEYGVCYAEANDRPDQCGRAFFPHEFITASIVDIPPDFVPVGEGWKLMSPGVWGRPSTGEMILINELYLQENPSQ